MITFWTGIILRDRKIIVQPCLAVLDPPPGKFKIEWNIYAG